tara:strand:+ start:17645 stop:18448 length:804 start_codon:yes stop_codon:yes gene_type:complete
VKKVLIYIIILGFIAIFGYKHLEEIQHPCADPLAYRIGSIDERHNISTGSFANLIRQAEIVWEEEFNQNLFQRRTDAKLVINLVFDERQEKMNIISGKEKKLDNQITLLAKQEADLESQKSAYEIELAKFNKIVSEWNAGPRTSQKTLSSIQKKEIALKNMSNDLEREILTYNLAVETYNEDVQNFNHDIPNEEEAGVARGNEEINIFLLNGDESDIYLIAHELGHAIGISGHATTSNSLMYYRLSDTPANKLSSEDISLLNSACKF